ncbi:hypothetical protein [Nostoc sp. UHCC 0252]|uniref:hypothetical protein n=1 Tax=Nostoc sp. UHCC 0252 TaxID=3110241 RepID=UPI002B207246|nr:hypothetical protein [Nostoc sp. UHCC 0252]MEA5605461.1 hypothetical protein [Nostoc sp. UHCC 0252]
MLSCETAGVLASFYIAQPVLKSGQSVFILSIIVALANFTGAISAKRDETLKPFELFSYFKDGLLWPTALPAIAKALEFQ